MRVRMKRTVGKYAEGRPYDVPQELALRWAEQGLARIEADTPRESPVNRMVRGAVRKAKRGR